ncbi:radical SAM family heme chaperone HemW [candidate division TA06 bacterium]|uniref:Heme chaperone HemW n=1 Tax=candidate division TA06 bacterium TaxID=2250710 RepID=A0A933IB05_UNCT6|nr:radical SAM family heme chaperone HemW [candidate division TA06 bacterium]
MNSVYIHIPFCLAKCHYCGFNSRPLRQPAELKKYFQALVREIAGHRNEIKDIKTIYLGGGTPTIASVALLGKAMNELRPWSSNAELTIEANPGTVTLEKLRFLRQMGFNRLSLGVQSFNDDLLKQMGRVHTGRQAANAFDLGSRAGFDNISLDLIYALPGQSLKDWKNDLEKALALGPRHISLYSLTYEKNTEFKKQKAEGRITPGDEETEADMYLEAVSRLDRAGLKRYEVSNFARKGFCSAHNINYWRAGDYLGFGAGAHSHRGGKRWSNMKNVERYLRSINGGQSPADFRETLSSEQQRFEALFLGLRMVRGIDIKEFQSKFGSSPLEHKPQVWLRWKEQGWAKWDKKYLRLTPKGLLLADGLAVDLV